jgi:hypothetical protein
MSDSLTDQYIKHIDSIIKMYEEAEPDLNRNFPDRIAYGIITRSKTLVEKISGSNSYYTKDIFAVIGEGYHTSYKVELIIGILTALKGDLRDGFLIYLSELVRGEAFNSYLDMASYLLLEGYKDAAAVIVGSTMEAHLRQLCVKYGIDTIITTSDGKLRPKSAAQINQELGKVAYSSFDQKQINTWQDLRNNAAHGDYEAYSDKQVKQFAEWLGDFVARKPA